MEVKLFEVRDRMTFIPAIAIKFTLNERESHLAGRVGMRGPFTFLARLSTMAFADDPSFWNDRTMNTVHTELLKNWDTYASGDVIDVEYLLGETKEPKTCEF